MLRLIKITNDEELKEISNLIDYWCKMLNDCIAPISHYDYDNAIDLGEDLLAENLSIEDNKNLIKRLIIYRNKPFEDNQSIAALALALTEIKYI